MEFYNSKFGRDPSKVCADVSDHVGILRPCDYFLPCSCAFTVMNFCGKSNFFFYFIHA